MELFLEGVVSLAGELDGSKIWKREILYRGLSGRTVERFYTSPTESYIFKPFGHEDHTRNETWVYENILVGFPPIYPKMLARSTKREAEKSWIIYEDLGHLNHIFNEKVATEITKLISYWHSFNIKKLAGIPLKGPKPFIEDMASSILQRKNQGAELLRRNQVCDAMIERIYLLLKNTPFNKRQVLSHGDLHIGNYAFSQNRIMVLDWEHTHINSPFWDLCHLLDVSHPMFAKEVTTEIREKVLDIYLEQAGLCNKVNGGAFKKEYYLFSATFSLWMLLLIHDDLHNPECDWNQDQLKRQLFETTSNLIQCVEPLLEQS